MTPVEAAPPCPYRPSPVETSFGYVFGMVDAPLGGPPAADPRAALDALMDAASDRGPVHVSFSGGRDSSIILAVATARARACGRPDPIPVTLRYPGEVQADEADWQEHVIRHLELSCWRVLDVPPGDHDLVGPVAAESLRRHGLLWPAPAATRSTLLDAAAGGVLLTGEGGDEILADGRMAMAAALLLRRVPPTQERLRLAAKGCAPRFARGPSLTRQVARDLAHPWLTPPMRAELHRRTVAALSHEPLRRDRAVDYALRARSASAGADTFRYLARQHDTSWVEPFREPLFTRSLARELGPVGPGGRTRTLLRLFGDLLPPEVLERRSKANFRHAYLGEHTRSFVREWEGEGVPHDLVDWRVVRDTLLSPRPNGAASLLLQSAWIATKAGGA